MAVIANMKQYRLGRQNEFMIDLTDTAASAFCTLVSSRKIVIVNASREYESSLTLMIHGLCKRYLNESFESSLHLKQDGLLMLE